MSRGVTVTEYAERGRWLPRQINELSTQSWCGMRQNRWWAAGYRFVRVPSAAGASGLVGFVLPTSVSTVLVALQKGPFGRFGRGYGPTLRI